jgi:hypothetical protein
VGTDDLYKSFLFIGDANPESATSKLAVANINYIKKRLESKPENWVIIKEIIEEEPLFGILVKLTSKAMEKLCHEEYRSIGEDIFSKISSIPHIILVHQSFFGIQPAPHDQIEDEYGFWNPNEYFPKLDDTKRSEIQAFFDRLNLNVVAYEKNVELSVITSEFVEQHHSNLLFRFYIPRGRMFSDQVDPLLNIFRDYINRTAGINVKQTTHATTAGTVYEFFGDGETTQQIVQSQLESFSQVVDLCIQDPSSAESLLVSMGANPAQASEIVSRYSKQMRRIATDMRHERDRAVLEISQRLESELVDAAPAGDLEAIRQIVHGIIPATFGASVAFGLSAGPSTPPITLNYRPQIIGQVQGIVAEKMYGTQNIGAGAAELIDLIERIGGSQEMALKSAVYELEDPNSSPEQVVTAKAKLKAFLGKSAKAAGKKVLEIGSDVLQAYIKSQLGIAS